VETKLETNGDEQSSARGSNALTALRRLRYADSEAPLNAIRKPIVTRT
jgi:hypothetical protein